MRLSGAATALQHQVTRSRSAIRIHEARQKFSFLLKERARVASRVEHSWDSGSKTVATTARQTADASKSLKKMEAGVGIEPAYTDLQDDSEQNDDDPV